MLVATVGFLLATLPLFTAAILVIGTATLVLIVVQPLIGLWLLPFTVPFGSIRSLSLAGFSVGATEGLVALTLAGWFARGVAQRRLQIHFPPLVLPLLLLVGALLVSMLRMWAVPPAVKELVKWGEILVVYVLAANLLRADALQRDVMVLLTTLLLASTLAAIHGVAGSLLRIGPPQFAILGGRLYRAFGTFGQPNPFGGYMNHSLPLAVSLAVVALGVRTGQRWRIWLILASTCGVLTLALVLSWSRGAWLGAMAGLGGVGLAWPLSILVGQDPDAQWQRWRRYAITTLWLAAGVVVAFVLIGGFHRLPIAVSGRIQSATATFTTFDARGANITDANFATLERVAHWQAAWDMWRDHFWTGVGIGNYAAAYSVYALPKWPYALGHAHNIYLNMAAETGLIGLLAYVLFIVAALWYAWRIARRADGLLAQGVAIGVLGILMALAVHNLFDNMYVHAMGVHLALALGLVSGFDRG